MGIQVRVFSSTHTSSHLIENSAFNKQVSLAMAALRLVVLECLMLVALAESKPGDVFFSCFFTPWCKIKKIEDVRDLSSDLIRLTKTYGGLFGKFLGCIGTVKSTGDGTGCYDDKMVKNTKCDAPCKMVKNKLKEARCYGGQVAASADPAIKKLTYIKC